MMNKIRQIMALLVAAAVLLSSMPTYAAASSLDTENVPETSAMAEEEPASEESSALTEEPVPDIAAEDNANSVEPVEEVPSAVQDETAPADVDGQGGQELLAEEAETTAENHTNSVEPEEEAQPVAQESALSDTDGEDEALVRDLGGLLVSAHSEKDANSWRYRHGERIQNNTQMALAANSLDASDAVAFGIDVSKYQGDIDWDKANQEIEFAIIRCGYGSNLTSQDDAYFEQNAQACERLGIPYGVYLYSYATTATGAKSEAEHVIRMLEGYNPNLPVYLDLEDSSISSSCSNAEILANAKVFCEAIQAAGYEVGVYANLDWWNTYLTSSTYDSWDRWVAQWGSSCDYNGSYTYWQYTSSGTVSGISGNVDCDYAMLLPQPEISALTNITNGVNVQWNQIKGAKKYRVYRRVSGGSWTRIGDTTSNSYVDTTAAAGTLYAYTVRCINTSGTRFTSSYNTTGKGIIRLTTPVFTLSGDNSGINVQWNVVPGATGYYVYRKISGASYSRIATITSGSTVSYADTTAKSGQTYTYTVRAYNGAFLSSFTEKDMAYVAAPELSTFSNIAAGVYVTWNAVPGAEKYRVYRRASGGSWTRIGDTTSNSYVDTTAAAGTLYAYTVRCINADATSFTSGYNTTGKGIIRLTNPVVTLTNGSSGVAIGWDKVAGATGYYVYRKVSGGSYSRIATVTSGSTVSYTDTTAASGQAYIYTVRAYNGAFLSSFTEKNITYIAAPVLSTFSNIASGIQVTWDAVPGAEKYRVYRRVSGGSWTRIGDTTSNSYVDTTAAAGTLYAYTVRCINADGTSFTSGYNTTGKGIIRLTNPVFTLSRNSSGIAVQWDVVTGAKGYYVYRKVSGGSYSRIATITSGSTVSYTDTTAASGQAYIYTVRAYNGTFLSSFTEKSVS